MAHCPTCDVEQFLLHDTPGVFCRCNPPPGANWFLPGGAPIAGVVHRGAVYRRRKVFTLSETVLAYLLRHGRTRWFRLTLWSVGDQAYLPPTAVIDGVWPDPQRRAICIVVCDPSFDPVPDGQESPHGGDVELHVAPDPDNGFFAGELDAAYAAIHDLQQRIKELGGTP